jgi:hypothetical protein
MSQVELISLSSSTIIDAIDDMRNSGLASMAFFYCDFRDQKKGPRGLLSSLLFQLCGQSNSYSEILFKFYSKHRDGLQGPSDAALTQCLKDILLRAGHPPIYIIIDALDECSNAYGMSSPRRKVLILLEELVKLPLPNLRICVTARPETDIKAVLNRLNSHSVSLHDEEGQRKDILEYIKSVVFSDSGMEKWGLEDKELVIGTLSLRANGM